MQNRPQRRANRNTASHLFATTNPDGFKSVSTHLTGEKTSQLFATTNPDGEDPPAPKRTWGCWEDPYCDKWGCLNKKTQDGLCTICSSSQPRTGTRRGIRGTDSGGTPLATRHPKNNLRRTLGSFSSRSHFFDRFYLLLRIYKHNQKGNKGTQVRQTHTREQGHRNTIK